MVQPKGIGCMLFWIIYCRCVGCIVLILPWIATYRDLVDDQSESLLLMLGRPVLMTLLGIAYFRRNIWIVRICGGISVLQLIFLVAGCILIDPLPLPLFEVSIMLAGLVSLSLPLLGPRAAYRPERVLTANVIGNANPDNPFAAPTKAE